MATYRLRMRGLIETEKNWGVNNYDLPQGITAVGREHGKILISLPEVSSRHGYFELNGNGVHYKDSRSTNGTVFIKDGSLTTRVLREEKISMNSGDRLIFGNPRTGVEMTLEVYDLSPQPL